MRNSPATIVIHHLSATTAILATAVIGNAAIGSLVVTTDLSGWFDNVGPVTAIDFTDLAQGEFVTDQYAHLGATFFGTAFGHHAALFATDGKGILGLDQPVVELEFDVPRTEFALQFASFNFMINFHLGEEFVGSTPIMSGFFDGPFVGITSSLPFDRVEMFAFSHAVTYIDNIYFGAPIPAPGALVLLAFAGVVSRRRRGA